MFGQFLNSLPNRVNSAVSGLFSRAKSAITAPFRNTQSASAFQATVPQGVDLGLGSEQRVFRDQLVAAGGTPEQAERITQERFADRNLAQQQIVAQSGLQQEGINPETRSSLERLAGGIPTGAQRPEQPQLRFNPQTGGFVDADLSVGGASGLTPQTSFNIFQAAGFDPVTGQSVRGAMGDPGGGGSNFTGLLGAQGGQATPFLRGRDVSDDRDRSGQSRGVSTPGVSPFGMSTLEGPIFFQENQIPPTVQSPTADAEIDVSVLGQPSSKVLTTNLADGENDRAQLDMAIREKYNQALKAQTIAGETTDVAPAISPDIQSILDTAPFDVASAMEQAINNSGLKQFQTQRVEALKALNSTVDAYKSIAEDIKLNPDLPKGLAQRRLQAVYEQQKNATSQLLGTLEVLDQQIDDLNFGLEREFGLIRTRAEQEENNRQRAQQRVNDNLSLLIDSGAIGGMSDFELNQWSELAGVPIKALEKIRETSLEPERNIITNEFADGTLRGIDQKTGETVWSIPGAARTTGTGIAPTQGFADIGVERDVRDYVDGLVSSNVSMEDAMRFARGVFSPNEATTEAINSVVASFYGDSIGDLFSQEGLLPGEEGGATLGDVFGGSRASNRVSFDRPTELTVLGDVGRAASDFQNPFSGFFNSLLGR